MALRNHRRILVLILEFVGACVCSFSGFTRGESYVWTTIAGTSGQAGSDDGAGSVAKFHYPRDIALDRDGCVYVSDVGNQTIRRVAPVGTNWIVTTIAGSPGSSGTVDGTNSDARFLNPGGLVFDGSDTLFVAGGGDDTIRKVTQSGTNWIVTTIAGTAMDWGSVDGTNSDALFGWPWGTAADSAGNVYVTEKLNNTVRKLEPYGSNWVVTTIAGLAIRDGNQNVGGAEDGTNSAARFNSPRGLTADRTGNLYVADSLNDTVRKLTPQGTNWVISTIAGWPLRIRERGWHGFECEFFLP